MYTAHDEPHSQLWVTTVLVIYIAGFVEKVQNGVA